MNEEDERKNNTFCNKFGCKKEQTKKKCFKLESLSNTGRWRHPDHGGDKDRFQELSNAYESVKIMKAEKQKC